MKYKGAIVENYIAQIFANKGYGLYYFKIENRYEIDFLIYKGNDIIPIEVKAGDNVKSISLNNYVEKFKPKYCIRISLKNFGFKDNIKSVPLYAAHLI